MALSYDDSNILMNDMAFRGRVKVAILHFGQYITNEDPATPAHATRKRWADGAFANPESIVQQITPSVVMEPHTQTDGKNVIDADLQTDVETVLNRQI